ncbi:potassium-transporting ATPase subunit C [Amycolatopsis suaedae]|uniref:Potassium-transporting ATPase KdpC subunit n=1 Tax=Amycolatopsis suaedae TaxID=2510978 RepID=A0A4Q7JBT7_9PSEU|nr:potassium-transporting ATPase subunit C [Amycolatopsis suaedae]RZQ64757.1 potassium-transporting ATPase subunit C [Amycolatopsis suaedae]
MKALFNQAGAAVRVLLVFTVLLGVVYPLGVWAVSRIPGLQDNAEGSVIVHNGQAAGSSLIGIDPVAADPARDPWFHTRPSAASLPASGGSNKSGFNEDQVALVTERRAAVAAREGVPAEAVPADAVTASGSGLDPQISVAYAQLQAPRVARNTGVPEDVVRRLIEENTTTGIGVPSVTVLELNLAVTGRKLTP